MTGKDRHRLLERQLRKVRDGTGAFDVERLLDLVSAAYAEQDEARRFNDHAVRLMSDEVMALNAKIRADAAAEARATEERLYALLESIADGVIVLDDHQRVVAFNVAAEAMFARARHDVRGLGFGGLGLVDEGVAARFLSGPERESTAEIEGVRSDGERFMAEVTVASISVDKAPRTVTLWRDITARKRAEDTLRRARDEARAADEAKTAFLATMSHEIRTPLNGVLGLAGALCGTPLSDGQHQMVRLILDSGEQLSAILSDVLDLATIESGHLLLEQAPFRPQVLLSDAAQLFKASAAAKGLALNTDFGPGLEGMVAGDPTRLGKVLQNLLSNAIKFTKAGEVRLSSRLDRTAEDGRPLLEVEVSDTGCGVPESGRERLFQRFSQVDNSATRVFGGTGLGLALCRELLGAMGGEVGYRPAAGGGSCFWFSVPLARPTETPEEASD